MKLIKGEVIKLDPTTRGDLHAELMRQWYEQNRERFFDRHLVGRFWRANPDRYGSHADEFMLRLIAAVYRTSKQLPD